MINGYSILITAYDTHNFIEECLDSVSLQDFFRFNNNYEILLGIDGCEKTLNKVIEIGGKYKNLTIFMMNSNMGTYVTMNTLLSISKYDKIIRFDSDDIMKLNLISEIDKYTKDEKIIKFKFCSFLDNSELCKIDTKHQHRNIAEGVLCYKKSIIDELGGYRNWICLGDSDLVARIKSKYNIKVIDKILFYRRIHQNSLTQNIDTGLKSDLRNYYNNLIEKKFKYIEPVINTYSIIEPSTHFDDGYNLTFNIKKEESGIINAPNNKKKSVTSSGNVIESKPMPQDKPEIKSQITSKPQKLFNPDIESKPKPEVKKQQPKPIEPIIEVTPIVKTIEPEQLTIKSEPSIVKPNTPQIKSPIKSQSRDNTAKSSISRIPNDLDIGRLRKQRLNFGRR